MAPQPKTELARRLELQEILEFVLGSTNVYFQPPPTITMKYPAIVYSHSDNRERFANDKLYLKKRQYMITIIDRDPDTLIPERLEELPQCSFSRRFTSDSLNHIVYDLYY